MGRREIADEPGLGKDIRGYTVGQCYDRRDQHENTEQFDREIAERADVWNSFNGGGK